MSSVWEIIDREVLKVERTFTKTTEVTPDFIAVWSFPSLQNVVKKKVPHLKWIPVFGRPDDLRKEQGKGSDGRMRCPSLLFKSFPG